MAIEDWSRPAWLILHALALSFSDGPQWKKAMDNFIYLIICGECKGHYRKFIETYDPTYLESKEKAFKFTVDLHNSVNKRLNKPELSLIDSLKTLQTLVENKPMHTVLFDFEEWIFYVDFPKYSNQEDLDEPKRIVKELFDFLKLTIKDTIFSAESFPDCI